MSKKASIIISDQHENLKVIDFIGEMKELFTNIDNKLCNGEKVDVFKQLSKYGIELNFN